MDQHIIELSKITRRLDLEATLYADELMKQLRDARELEEQYEIELAAASFFTKSVVAENTALKNEVAYLKTILRPTIVCEYPDEQ